MSTSNRMNNLRNVTLVFLIKKSQGRITDICLAMKKRGFGINKWNGVGGKVNLNTESIEEAAQRETKEEIGVLIKELNKVAEIHFYYLNNPDWNQVGHIYFVENWTREPEESEEMSPKWFSVNELPFKDMWPDDIFWLPEVIKGNLLKAVFTFGDNNIVLDKEIKFVTEL